MQYTSRFPCRVLWLKVFSARNVKRFPKILSSRYRWYRSGHTSTGLIATPIPLRLMELRARTHHELEIPFGRTLVSVLLAYPQNFSFLFSHSNLLIFKKKRMYIIVQARAQSPKKLKPSPSPRSRVQSFKCPRAWASYFSSLWPGFWPWHAYAYLFIIIQYFGAKFLLKLDILFESASTNLISC